MAFFHELSRPRLGPEGKFGGSQADPDDTRVPGGMLVLTLDDVLARVPTRALKPGLHDPSRRLHFAMEELLEGISRGRATIMLSKLAERYPETFEAPAPGTVDSPIYLPLQKLMQQIGRTTRQPPEKPAPPAYEPAPVVKAPEPAPVAKPEPVEPDPVVEAPVTRLLRRLKVMQEPVESAPVVTKPAEPPPKVVAAEAAIVVERMESAKAEAAKAEATKAAKAEAARLEAAKVVAAKAEAAKVEAERLEAARVAAAKAEAARVEAAKAEAAKAEAARVEAAKLEAAKVEAARLEAAKAEAARLEAAKAEAARLEAAKALEKLPPLSPPPLPVVPPPEAKVLDPLPTVVEPAPEVPHSPILENPPANLASNVRIPAGRPLVRPPSLQGPAGLVAPETAPPAAPAMPGFVFAPRPKGQLSDFPQPAYPPEDEIPEVHIPPLFAVHPGPPEDDDPPAPPTTFFPPPPIETTPELPPKSAPVDESKPEDPSLPEVPKASEETAPGEDEDDALERRISVDSGARPDDLLGTHFTLARIDQEPLQAIFMTEEFLDLPRVSQLSCEFPGITGCMIVAGDAVAQGGERPAGLDAQALCKLTKQLSGVALAFPEELPAVQTYTLHVGNRALSIFSRPNVSLCLVHSPRGFLPGVRERLAAVADTLSRGLGGEAGE